MTTVKCLAQLSLLTLAALCLSGCPATIPVAPAQDRIQGTWVPGVEAYQVNRFTVIEQEAGTTVCTWISDFYVCY